MRAIREWLRRFLGMDELERRLDVLEGYHRGPGGFKGPEERDKAEILKILVKPMSTKEIAGKLGKSRGWASRLLNELERDGKVRECGYRKRRLLYERTR